MRCLPILVLLACSDPPAEVENPLENPEDGPPAGNSDSSMHCDIPAEAGLADVSVPDNVVGTGTPESCTSEATVQAVAAGGVVTFDCGPSPVTIELDETLRVFNDTGPEIVLDGGGLVTLSGGGEHRILYMNTCDPDLVWTTSSCNDQDHPRLTVQNLTFIDGDAGDIEGTEGGGGAIWARGGRLRLVNTRFFGNRCAEQGPDVGGAAVRAFDQHDDQPIFVVNSTFGGETDLGNRGSNGGAISSIGVSWTLLNSLLSHNDAVGNGGNPAQDGTPGGGSGGAIYNDGNEMTLSTCGTLIEHNTVVQHGSAIFFVSNNHTGDVRLESSALLENTGGSWYTQVPMISAHDDTPIVLIDTEIAE